MAKCNNKTEVYSRVVGYFRPIDNWNKGKKEEFKRRLNMRIADKDTDIVRIRNKEIQYKQGDKPHYFWEIIKYHTIKTLQKVEFPDFILHMYVIERFENSIPELLVITQKEDFIISEIRELF